MIRGGAPSPAARYKPRESAVNGLGQFQCSVKAASLACEFDSFNGIVFLGGAFDEVRHFFEMRRAFQWT